MNGRNPSLFTKVILVPDVDDQSLIGASVEVEVDQSLRIGHSIAVLDKGTVIGHLERRAARVIWRHLRSDPVTPITAEIYPAVGKRKNERWFSAMSHSFEIGIKIDFHVQSQEDARLLLAHITRKKLHSFAGVEVDNCPEELKSLVCPYEDDNGVASLYFT